MSPFTRTFVCFGEGFVRPIGSSGRKQITANERRRKKMSENDYCDDLRKIRVNC